MTLPVGVAGRARTLTLLGVLSLFGAMMSAPLADALPPTPCETCVFHSGTNDLKCAEPPEWDYGFRECKLMCHGLRCTCKTFGGTCTVTPPIPFAEDPEACESDHQEPAGHYKLERFDFTDTIRARSRIAADILDLVAETTPGNLRAERTQGVITVPTDGRDSIRKAYRFETAAVITKEGHYEVAVKYFMHDAESGEPDVARAYLRLEQGGRHGVARTFSKDGTEKTESW